MFRYVLSIVLIILSNVFYNIIQKVTPRDANPFAALLVTYLVSAGLTAAALFITRPGKGLGGLFTGVNWTSFALAFCLVGLEFGYLTAYRAGWNVSVVTIVANIVLAILLIPVGVLMFKEGFSPWKLLGTLLCIAGLLLINKG